MRIKIFGSEAFEALYRFSILSLSQARCPSSKTMTLLEKSFASFFKYSSTILCRFLTNTPLFKASVNTLTNEAFPDK